MKKNFFYSVEQDNFSLNTVYSDASVFEFINAPSCSNNYKKIIDEFVLSLKSGNFKTQ
jgi:hypothetical protein